MRVQFDTQIFSWQRYGGISRYFTELMRRLPEAGVDWRMPLRVSDNAYIRDIPQFSRLPALSFVPDHRKVAAFINSAADRRSIRRSDFDLLHITGTNPRVLRGLGRPYVCTVHDLILELFPERMGDPRKVDRNLADKRTVIEGAARIIAISRHTRADLLKYYGIDASKVNVVPHGVYHPSAAPQIPAWAPVKYFLFVGERGDYKNFRILADAFSRIVSRFPDVKLVCTGRPFSAAELSELAPEVRRNAIARFVSQSELAGLYSGAIAMVAPSKYEGFGMPLLEAGAYGCPVVLSRSSCFPEVAGEGGIFFDADDSRGLEEAMARLLEDADWRKSRGDAMLRRADEFSWERTAGLTARTYARALTDI